MKPIHILLVEDNEGDILLTTEALSESNIENTITVVKNGKQALDYVFQRNGYEDSSLPDLILLDINLPLKSGHEVLVELKSSDEFKHIPIIMLTTSSSQNDIHKCYKNHANCYITKPVDINDFMDAIATVEHFWMNIVQLDH